MAPPVVTLSVDDLRRAVRHGREVHSLAKNQRQRDRFQPDRDDLKQRIESINRELAVARYTGLAWNGDLYTLAELRRRKPADVGDDIEVRGLDPSGRYFAVRDGDPRDRRVVVVAGRGPAYLILGFVQAGSVMVDRYRYDDRHRSPYWRVPSSELRPLNVDLTPT